MTFSSSSSTAFAMSFFCSKTASKFNFGTLALITEELNTLGAIVADAAIYTNRVL